MSEKVVLTKEQAEALELLKRNWSVDEIISRTLKGKVFKEHYNDTFKVFGGLSMYEIAHGFKYGFETEKLFKKGEWVKVNWQGEKPSIHKVTKDSNHIRVWIDGGQANKSPGIHIVEHATPEEIAEEKQRRWWESNNRAVWELKEGDILKDIYQREIHEVVGIGFMGSVMFEGDASYRAVDEIKNKCTVVCFAEDRKDVDHG